MFSFVRKLCHVFGVLILCAFLSTVHASPALAGKAGINIGDHFGEIDQAAAIVGDGGWIVVMAQPGDCMALSEMIKKYDKINFVIRGHHPSTTLMTPDHAKAWAYTLANMDTGGNKVYFYPINEPFTRGAAEGFSNDPQTTATMVNDYVSTLLNEYPDIRKKVVMLSPMFNRSHPGFADFMGNIRSVNDSFFEQFDGIAMNLYDYEDCGSPFCHPLMANNAQRYAESLTIMGAGAEGKPVFAVESGVVPGQDGVEYIDDQLKRFYEAAYDEGGPFNDIVMSAVFSYDPHRTNWSIYGSQTAQLFSEIGGGQDPPATEWTEGDTAAFKEFIQPKLDSGEVVKCGECGLSPVSPSGETYCSATGKYTLDIFPDYEIDEKDYYLYPICEDGQKCREGSKEQQLIAYKKSLIEQGYKAHCAENEINIAGNYSGDWGRYLALLPFNAAVYPKEPLEAISTQVIDYTTLKIPVFRDQSGKRWRMTSIEEFFGFRDIYTGEDSIALLNSSPVEKLLSQEQRCQMSVEVLKDARTLCEKEDPDISDCALNTVVPDPSNELNGKKRFDILADYEASGLSCSEIIKTDTTLRRSLSKVPLYLERAYRVGFLVTSVRQLSPDTTGEFFNFLSQTYNNAFGKRYGSKVTEVNIMAFKIPDVGLSHLKSLPYNDPLQVTRDSLLSSEQRKTNQKTQEDEQKYYKHNTYTDYNGTGLGGPRWMGGNTNINCALTPGCSDLATPGIDPLFRALVDMINAETGVNVDGKIVPGYAYTHSPGSDPDYEPPNTQGAYLNCSPTRVKISAEKVEVIGDSANIAADDKGTTVLDDLGNTNTKMMESLIERLKKDPGKLSSTNFPPFITNFNKTENNSPDRVVEVNTYLIYPGDYEIGTVADAIRSPFVPFEMAKQVDENRRDGCDPYVKDCIEQSPKREYRFAGIAGVMNLIGGKIPHSFLDLLDPIPCDPDNSIANPLVRDCKTKDFLLSVVSDPQKVVAIPGEKVGFWMKEIQKSLSKRSSMHYAYLQTCRTTEEFLLGACGSGVGSIANPTNQFPNAPGTGNCQPASEANQYCSINALMERFPSFGYETAREASIICQQESGGNQSAKNISCFDGGTDYSIGLFQFNMMAHCPGCLANPLGYTNQDGPIYYTSGISPCTTVNQSRLDEYTAAYLSPDYNLQRMFELSNGGQDWGAWSAARYCGIE